MKVLLIGSSGMLGWDVKKALEKKYDLICPSSKECNITKIEQVMEIVKLNKPDIIINCAAYTNVDGCETNEEEAFQINAVGSKNLAIASKEVGAKLVHVSTDYVFDGKSGKSYVEADQTNPVNVYGKSKLAGENFIKEIYDKAYIVRTSWLYGENGHNFVKTMIELSKKLDSINVVNDQIGSPTYTKDLAYAIKQLIEQESYGVFHITNSDYCSWYEYAKEIFNICDIDIEVNPVTSEEFTRPAIRPKYSVIENERWKSNGNIALRSYKEALREYISIL